MWLLSFDSTKLRHLSLRLEHVHSFIVHVQHFLLTSVKNFLTITIGPSESLSRFLLDSNNICVLLWNIVGSPVVEAGQHKVALHKLTEQPWFSGIHLLVEVSQQSIISM